MKKISTLAAAALAMTACTTTRYIPVETVRTEVEYRDRVLTRTDSIHITDSVYIHQQGDTVYRDRTTTVYRDRTVTDTLTVYAESVDSVAVPYPVEKPLTRWQQTKQDIGGVAIGVALADLVAGATWLAWRIRKKLHVVN